MTLVSVLYIAFLSIISLLYYSVPQSWKRYLLIGASLLFYGINQGAYLGILIISIGANYALCMLYARYHRVIWVYAVVLFNVSLLSLFKYLPAIFGIAHNPGGSWIERLVIPIGLSFFSFQAISYILDMHWSGKKKNSTFAEYSLFMSFFPQLLAGPIARGKSFIPQIANTKACDPDDVVNGLRRILWGFFKKVLIASNLSPYTDLVFQNYNAYHGITIILAVIAYLIQIYMDFSGYTDIALGSAKVLGYDLMENFRLPLFARSVSDFWRRWHISLSSWARDYIFMPLQYQTRNLAKLGMIFSTLITFLVIGVWHGANWTLVMFGLLQGIAVCWESLSSGFRERLWTIMPEWMANAISNMLVFIFIAVSAIFLRTSSLAEAVAIISRMSFNLSGLYLGSRQLLLFALIPATLVFGVDVIKKDQPIAEFIGSRSTVVRWSFYVISILAMLLIGSLNNENFIYYQY